MQCTDVLHRKMKGPVETEEKYIMMIQYWGLVETPHQRESGVAGREREKGECAVCEECDGRQHRGECSNETERRD